MAVIYFAENIVYEEAGTSFVQVNCEACGDEYFYPLTRIGHGYDTAHYGLGAKSAQKSAAVRAENDLNLRLSTEAELVPCPRCGWISQELVRGYRRGRYLRLQTCAVAIPIIGIAITGIVIWFLYKGPVQDRRFIEPVLIGGSGFFLLSGAGLFSLRVALTAWINPNRNYPQPTKSPTGTPPAYVRNAAGEFILAAVNRTIEAAPKLLLQIGRHRMNYIDRCCDCNSESTALKEFDNLILGHATKLTLARCPACTSAVKKRYLRNWFVSFCMSLFLAAPIVVMLSNMIENFLVAACILLPINFAVSAYWVSSSTSSVRIRSLDTSRGVLELTFQCKAFERHVAGCIAMDENRLAAHT